MSRRRTQRRADAEAQSLLEFSAPARRGDSALDKRGAANPATRPAASPATRYTPSPRGAKYNSPGQRPGNLASQSPSRPEGVEESELPEGWHFVELGGLMNHCAFGPRFPGSLYAADGNVATLRTTDISDDGHISYSTMPRARVSEAKFRNHLLQKGDLLVTRSGTCGIGAVFEGFDVPTLAGAFLIRCVLKTEVCPHFVRDYLNSPPGRRRIESIAVGAVQKNISGTSLKAFSIPLPPLREQRAIAGVLRTVQRAKEACEQVLAATRQLKASLLHHLFTYGPVPFPQADRVTLKETEVGETPSHWDVVPLGEGFSVFSGFAFKSQDFALEGIPIIKIGSLQNGTVIIYKETSYFPRYLVSAAHEKFVLRPGDVLIAMTGATTGKVSTVPDGLDGALLNQRVGKISPREDGPFLLDFAKWFIPTQFFQTEIQENILKSAQGNISPKSIERILMPKPSLEEQREIARQLAAVDAKLVALESRRSALASLFASLLHHLMTGRVRLPEFAKGTP